MSCSKYCFYNFLKLIFWSFCKQYQLLLCRNIDDCSARNIDDCSAINIDDVLQEISGFAIFSPQLLLAFSLPTFLLPTKLILQLTKLSPWRSFKSYHLQDLANIWKILLQIFWNLSEMKTHDTSWNGKIRNDKTQKLTLVRDF